MRNLILLQFLIFFIQFDFFFFYTYSKVKIDDTLEQTTDEFSTSNSFEVSFSSFVNDFDFLFIKIKNILSKSKFGQISFFSYSDKDCKIDRRQMSVNTYDESAFIINKTEIKEKGEFYICVNCIFDSSCSYTVQFDQNYLTRLPFPGFSYSYYISEYYKDMTFGLRPIDDIYKIILNNNNPLQLFWVKRMNNDQFIHYYDNRIPADYNAIYLFNNITELTRCIDFNISSYEGDYVRTGSSLIFNKVSYTPINVNDLETMGYLEKGILDEECFFLNNYYSSDSSSLFYLYGIIYNKFAKIYFKNKNSNNIISGTEKEIIDGSFIEVISNSELTSRKFCVSLLTSDKYEYLNNITFTIQLISNENINHNYIDFPQMPGIIYPRFLKKGELIILSGIKPLKKSNRMSISSNIIYGFPNFYLDYCKDFPFCSYYQDYLFSIGDVSINRIKDYEKYKDESIKNPFNFYQPLLIINCPDITDFCIFDTTFFSENDFVILKEGKTFNQSLFSEKEKNYYLIDYENHLKIKQIIIELLIFNGNANLNIDNKYEIVNYFLLNKNIYIINSDNINEKKIEFYINADKESLYSIRYSLIREDDNEELNNMNIQDIMGINYIDYINTTYKYKNIEVSNSEYNRPFPILFNFYSPNCKFQISKNDTIVQTHLNDNFYQEYISDEKVVYNNYNISIKELEPLNYDNKKCLLYINNIKLSKENSNLIGTLAINENIPQKITFENIKKIKYIYPNIDDKKDTLIYLKANKYIKYLLTINDNSNNIIQEGNYSDNKIIYIKKNEIKCIYDEICNLYIEISLIEKNNIEYPIIETTVRQINNKFIYLEKGIIKNDLVPINNNLFLYTDIGHEDEGYFMINLLKGKFEIKGIIVQTNEIKLKGEIDWISLENEKKILDYDFYTKKLFFTKDDTSNCEEGCYLLINVEAPIIVNIDDILNEKDFLPITYMASLTNKEISKTPKIRIDADEYIIGSLFNNNYEGQYMYELYELNIPYNAHSIDIECQSEKAKLLIFIGNKEIKYDNSDFEIEAGQVFSLSNSEILERVNNNGLNNNINSIENINIIFFVYAEKSDIINSTYFLNIHLNNNENIKIYEINTDQKTLCYPEKFNNTHYRCLYMIKYCDFDVKDYTILYSKSEESKNSIIYMYGNYINKETDYLDNKDIIPKEDATYKTDINKSDFIFLPPNKNNDYFYLSIVSNSPNMIELYSSFYNYFNELIPNPDLKQFFALDKTLKNEMKIKFISKESIMVNLVSLYGKGTFDFNGKSYNLDEKNDKISLALNLNADENIIFKNNNNNELNNDTIPEFVFYIEYYFRNSTINLDKISLNEKSDIIYKNADFPLYLFSKINNTEHDINIFFNLYDLTLKDKTKLSKTVRNRELIISSDIIEEKNLYTSIIKNKESSKIKGIYDPSVNAGQIYIPKECINKINVDDFSKYVFYLGIEKNGLNNDIIYDNIIMKTTYIYENSGTPVIENKYHYGKITSNDTINTYKLKVDSNYKYMNIQFSSNSEIIEYNITTNDNFKEYKYEEDIGKVIISFENPNNADYVNLNVFMNTSKIGNESSIEYLNNYVFKYINSNITNANEYQISNNNPIITCTLTYNNNNITTNIKVKYNKIENQQNYDVIYSLIFVKNDDEPIKNEKLNTIALTESNSYITQIRKNKVDDDNNEIDIPVQVFDKNFSHIGLIAQIIDGENIEYIVYDPITSQNKIISVYGNNNNNKNDKYDYYFIIIILLIVIILIIIIGIIIFWTIKMKKKRSESQIIKQVEMSAPIEYDDVLLDKGETIN